MKEIRANAKELMKGFCKVCPVCDGRACVGEVPGMGGLGTAASFKNNVKELANISFNMRVLHDATEPETSTSVLGLSLSMPVMAAPIGGVSFNMGGKIEEDAYADAIVGGCKSRNLIGCTGDGVPPFIHEAGNAAIAKMEGYGIPFVKPWDSDELDEKLNKAAETGCSIIGMDVDAAGLVTLRKMGRPVSPKSEEQLAELVNKVHKLGKKFVVKGIMTEDEARKAVDAGVDGIVVSNHGGRVLDHTPGTARVLPGVADAVSGKVAILVDGGVRDGADVLKMLALGADAVLIGRPFSVAAVGGLQNGVEAYIDQLQGQLIQAMVLTGCKDVSAIGRSILHSWG